MKHQKTRLLAALKRQPMTTLEIIKRLGIVRPAAVVLDLRKCGWEIETEMVDVLNRWQEKCHVAKYRLHGLGPQRSLALNDKHYAQGISQHSASKDQENAPSDGWVVTPEQEALAKELEKENQPAVSFNDLDGTGSRDSAGADETTQVPNVNQLGLF